jgi:hypothetical protein
MRSVFSYMYTTPMTLYQYSYQSLYRYETLDVFR